MTRVIITDYVSDGGETYTFRVAGIEADVAVWIGPDGERQEWIGGEDGPSLADVLRYDDVEPEIDQAIAEFGDTLLREYEARDIHKIIREAELAAVRALAALHNDDDKEN